MMSESNFHTKTGLLTGVEKVNFDRSLFTVGVNASGKLQGTYHTIDLQPFSLSNDPSQSSTLFNTQVGGLLAFSELTAGGRVAVFANETLFQEGLYQDPALGDWGRVVFNTLNWAGDVARTPDSDTTLYALNLGDSMTGGDYTHKNSRSYANSPDDGHSLKVTSFTYQAPSAATGAVNAGNILADALAADSTWTEPVDVIILDAGVTKEEILIIQEWMTRTDGGVVFNLGTAEITPPLRAFLDSLGFNITAGNGPLQGIYTPDRVDLTDVAILDAELHEQLASGLLSIDQNIGLSSTAPITVSGKIALPNQDALGPIEWSTSDSDIITSDGRVVSSGTAVLTAQRTLPDGSTSTAEFYVSTHGTLVGSVTGFVITGNHDYTKLTDASFLKNATPHFFTTDSIAYDETGELPTKGKVSQEKLTTNLINSSLDQPTTLDKASVIALVGSLVPKTSGTYLLNLLADDRVKFIIESDGGRITEETLRTKTKVDGTDISVELTAQESYRFWLLYEDGGPVDEWGKDFNYFNLSWKPPGANAFEPIPSSALVGTSVPSNSTSLDAIALIGDLISSSNSVNLTIAPDKIFDVNSLIATFGNSAPTIDNQTLNLLEEFNHIPPSNLGLTESIPSQASAFFLRVTDTNGNNIAALEYIELAATSDFQSLANELESSINEHLPTSRAVSVTYDSTKNILNLEQADSGTALVFSDFIIVKDAQRAPIEIGQLTSKTTGSYSSNPATATESQAVYTLNTDDIDSVYRIHLKLIQDGTELNYLDVPLFHFGKIYMWDVDPRFEHLEFSTVAKDDGTTTVTVTDLLGRDIVDFSLTDRPIYEPLASAIVENQLSTGSLSLGAIQGQVDATDPEGAALTYSLVEHPLFGDVFLNSTTGAYTYVPDPDAFKGFDQFHVSVSDGTHASPPAAIKIIPQTPYTDSPVSITEIAFSDPVYDASVAPDYTTPIADDLVIEDLFFAQTWVQRPDDPYLKLVADRWVQFKLNATSASGKPAPEFEIAVYDISGNQLGTRILSGPDILPTSVDLPSDNNIADLDRGHTLTDSYVADIPGAWVQPGMKVQVRINDTPYNLDSLGYNLNEGNQGNISPDVGAGNVPVLSVYHAALGVGKELGLIEGGLQSLGEEMLAKLPLAGIRFFNWPIDTVEKLINTNTRVAPYTLMTGDKDNVPGADTLWGGGGYNANINWAYANSSKVIAANFLASGQNGNGWYSNTSIDAGEGGGVGGGYKGGGDAGTATTWHEFIGHGGGIGHVAEDKSFPYNNGVNPDINFQISDTLNGTVQNYTQNGMVGSDWAFDQANGVYLPNYRLDDSNTVQLSTSPMAGSRNRLDDYQFALFSDWEITEKLLPNVERLIKWTPNAVPGSDTEDGGFAGEGYFSVWGLPETAFNVEEITGVAADARLIVSAQMIYTDERSSDAEFNTLITIKDRSGSDGNKIKIENDVPSAFSIKVGLDDGSDHLLHLRKEWIIVNAQNDFGYTESLLPHLFNEEVYFLTADLVDVNGNVLASGQQPAVDINLRARKTIGDLPAEYFDVVSNTGEITDNSDYVVRVSYMTDMGLITDHLAVPNGALPVSGRLLGMNLPVKGELVRVDLVDTGGVGSAYTDNNIIASMINPDSLANAVVGNADFTAKHNALNLPEYWNGGAVTWTGSKEGLIDPTTRVVDTTKIDDLAFIQANVSFEQTVETHRFKVADLMAAPASPGVDTNAPQSTNSQALANLRGAIDYSTVVFDADFDDPEGSTVMYRLDGRDKDKLTIDPFTGEIHLGTTVDLTQAQAFQFKVIAYDAANNEASQDLSISTGRTVKIKTVDDQVVGNHKINAHISSQTVELSASQGALDLQHSEVNSGSLIMELTTSTNNAVGISDIISQLRSIVGLSQLSGLEKAAADFNADGAVGISDVISSLRVIVGLENAPDARLVAADGRHLFESDAQLPSELFAIAPGDADLSWVGPDLV